MNAKIITFSSRGDTTLLEYDPATADMDDKWAAKGGKSFKADGQIFD
jgi:hypothetical protein